MHRIKWDINFLTPCMFLALSRHLKGLESSSFSKFSLVHEILVCIFIHTFTWKPVKSDSNGINYLTLILLQCVSM